MGQRRPRDLDGLLDLPHRHLAVGLHEKEEHLKSAQMGERLERLDVRLVGSQLRQRQATDRLHVSKYIEISNRYQAAGADRAMTPGCFSRSCAGRSAALPDAGRQPSPTQRGAEA